MKGTLPALFDDEVENELDGADGDDDEDGAATDAEVERLALAKSDGSVEVRNECWSCLSALQTHRSMLLLFDANDIEHYLCKNASTVSFSSNRARHTCRLAVTH